MRILLNKNKSKESVNINKSLAVYLNGSKRLLPLDPIESNVSQIEQYYKEREQCNKIRLTVVVNPICSNVLYNNVTEIVKNEGSSDSDMDNKIIFFNYKVENDDLKKIFFKKKDYFINGKQGDINNAVKDTQLSSKYNGFIYHCGVDMFNNHYIRSKTFKTVCPNKKSEDTFNTISDFARQANGDHVKGHRDVEEASEDGDFDMHIYLNEEIMSYKESVEENLLEENGWFGFKNVGKLKVYDLSKNDNKEDYDWFKAINYKKPCDFIDLYPERDLFYFNPKYNKFRKREEKNWNYCITYPSECITDNIPFIKVNKELTTLKVFLFDDETVAPNGVKSIVFYTICKHGLKEDDYVNIYVNDELFLENANVISTDDDYTFEIFSDGNKISSKWVTIQDAIESENVTVSDDKRLVKIEDKIFYTLNGLKVNIDENAQDISFAKVHKGKPVRYYVRKFSKIPNWKFSKLKINDNIVNDSNYMLEYQSHEMEFESHVGKMAFSKNIYGDTISEIVFTDDIDISYLKDNLGRPLTDIYLTIIKNNSGYKQWYGKNGIGIDITNDDVEFSHCFGKVNCSFKLSEKMLHNEMYSNLLLLNNIDNKLSTKGLDVSSLNNRDYDKTIATVGDGDDKKIVIDSDEIIYKDDISFYGDLCCYSDSFSDEQIIQDIDFRFNTAQRELTKNDTASSFIRDFVHDEIISDDYDSYGFRVKEDVFINSVSRKEGYYYKPHYRIPIKKFSNELSYAYPSFLKIREIYDSVNANDENIKTITIKSLRKLFFTLNDIIYIYDKIKKRKYKTIVKTIINDKTIELLVDDDSDLSIGGNLKENFIIFTIPEEIPSYADFSNDNTCRFYWRKIIQNGLDNEEDKDMYPFTNGALYVNKMINLYLRRQNPSNVGYLRSSSYPYGHEQSTPLYGSENKYYNEEDIEC